jgi:hypothetical protein
MIAEYGPLPDWVEPLHVEMMKAVEHAQGKWYAALARYHEERARGLPGTSARGEADAWEQQTQRLIAEVVKLDSLRTVIFRRA